MTPIIQKFVGIIYQTEQNIGFLFAKPPCQYADACYSDRMAHLTTSMQWSQQLVRDPGHLLGRQLLQLWKFQAKQLAPLIFLLHGPAPK